VQAHFDAIVELGQHDHDNAAQAAFLLLRWSAGTKSAHLLRFVPPDRMVAAANMHDERVSACLSCLLYPEHRHVLIGSDAASVPACRLTRASIAQAQSWLPTQLGGLGLSSAEWTSAAAYTAGWTDFLRFMSENTHVFPALSPHITAAALSTSQLAPVLELRATWDFLADFLTVDHDDISVARDGHETLRVCLGETVTAPYLLARAKAGAQKRLSHAVWSAFVEKGWNQHAATTRKDVRRLTNCGGSEAAWVVAMPTRPQFCMTNAQWRDAFAFRLALPIPSLMTGIGFCDCHERFQRRTGEIARDAGSRRGRRGSCTPQRRRRRKPPKPVDEEGEHDQVCKHAFALGRHDDVQHEAQREFRRAHLRAELASVRELRRGYNDRSQKKADLLLTGLHASKKTLLDLGFTHSTIDTYLNNKSMSERAAAANAYAKRKHTGYVERITEAGKEDELEYASFTIDTYGAFGKSAWAVITKATDPRRHPRALDEHNVWSRPDPKRRFMLSVAFALQRGNADMFARCNARRTRNRSENVYSLRLSSPEP
jgi:hypothetical protein